MPPVLLHEPHESAELPALLGFVDEQERFGAGAELQAVGEHLLELGKVAAAIDEGAEPRVALEVGDRRFLVACRDAMVDEARLADLPGPLDEQHVLVRLRAKDELRNRRLDGPRDVWHTDILYSIAMKIANKTPVFPARSACLGVSAAQPRSFAT